MAKAPRLKVYAAQLGFFDTVVAASNQTAALKAWGVHRNLFADGSAAPAADAAAIAAAEQSPGVVLRRPVGSTHAYTADAAAALNVPDTPPSRKGERPTRTSSNSQRQPDRAALTAAEKDVAALVEQRNQTLRDLDRQRRALDEEADRRRRDFDRRLGAAAKALTKAQAAFRKAGGEP